MSVVERHERLQELFSTARRLDEGARDAWLDEHCPADMRDELDRLLAHDAAPSRPVDAVLGGGAAKLLAQDLAASGAAGFEPAERELPKRIGEYTIERLIGGGGMGFVYEARQQDPDRRVALKVIRTGMVTRTLMQRFRHEAQVLGRLEHPGIARIYEAGSHDDGSGAAPFFAMEYVPDAKSITAYARQRNLTARERLELFADVCDAVHHGHQKGIIHRDLKPENMLVTPEGVVKIIDFGVARATDSDVTITTQRTEIGQLVGTARYMSPEQVAADPQDIDTRSDVYALGVVLYELLVGRLPYAVEGLPIFETVRVIRDESPTRLSAIDRLLRGDVETIAAKALVKERERRYQSAAELAEDIRRYLRDEPILARPMTTLYQFRKFARRNKGLVAGISGGVTVALVAMMIATGVSLRQAGLARDSESRALREADRSRIAAAAAAIEVDDRATARQFLGAVGLPDRNWEWHYQFGRLDLSVAVAELGDTVAGAAFSPDGTEIVTVTNTGLVQRWDGGLVEARSIRMDEPAGVASFGGGASRLAGIVGAENATVVVWDTATGDRINAYSPGDGGIQRVALSPDGRYLAMGGRTAGLFLCDLAEGSTPVQLEESGLLGFAFSGDSRHLAGGFYRADSPSPVVVYDCATGAPTGRRYGHVEHPDAIVLADGGSFVAVADATKSVTVSDFRDSRRIAGHAGTVTCLALGQGGRHLLTGSTDDSVRLWDVERREQIGVFVGHDGRIDHVSFDPAGGRVMAVSGRTVRLWSIDANVSPTVLGGHTSYVYGVAFTSNGSRVVSGGWDETLRIWDATTGACLSVVHAGNGLEGDDRVFDVDATDTLIATAHEGPVRIWNARTGRRITDLDPGRPGRVIALRFTPDGSRLAARTRDTVSIWDPRAGALLLEREVPLDRSLSAFQSGVTISGDGSRFAVEDDDHTVTIRDTRTGAVLHRLAGHTHFVAGLAFSADGSRLATGSLDNSVRLWDAVSGEPIAVLAGHHDRVYAVAFTPDGTRLASGANDNTIRFWDVATREQVALIKGHGNYVYDLAFSPDGSRLVSGSGDHTARVWDTVPVHQRFGAETWTSSPSGSSK